MRDIDGVSLPREVDAKEDFLEGVLECDEAIVGCLLEFGRNESRKPWLNGRRLLLSARRNRLALKRVNNQCEGKSDI